MREFFGFGGYNRTPAGYMSWQHIMFVTCFMIAMVTLAVYFGRRNKGESEQVKNKVLIWAAILIDSFELFKIVLITSVLIVFVPCVVFFRIGSLPHRATV